jgi:hypothetical protein
MGLAKGKSSRHIMDRDHMSPTAILNGTTCNGDTSVSICPGTSCALYKDNTKRVCMGGGAFG